MIFISEYSKWGKSSFTKSTRQHRHGNGSDGSGYFVHKFCAVLVIDSANVTRPFVFLFQMNFCAFRWHTGQNNIKKEWIKRSCHAAESTEFKFVIPKYAVCLILLNNQDFCGLFAFYSGNNSCLYAFISHISVLVLPHTHAEQGSHCTVSSVSAIWG